MPLSEHCAAPLFLLALLIGAANAAAGEIDRDDFGARAIKTDIPEVWELFVENESGSNAEVEAICEFGRLSSPARVSVVVPANCTAKILIYDDEHYFNLAYKPTRPKCRIVSVEKSSKRNRTCPDS